MTRSLVVLAAGMGSRYGGTKQHESVGPSGETLLDYTAYDAAETGFTRLVFVTRPELLSHLQERTGRFAGRIEVRYALQRFDQPPAPRGERRRPWGTVQAVLCAAAEVDGPFAVLNADDFYGREALFLMGDHLTRHADADDTFAVLGYRLRDTLSDHGGVTRAVCETDESGLLQRIVEVTGLVARNGSVVGRTLAGSPMSLTGEETISRNCWAFTQALFGPLRTEFEAFVAASSDPDAEFLLPVAMNVLVASGRAVVRVVPAASPAFGLTHPADLEVVRAALRRLVAAGEYPPSLWS